MNTQEEGQQQPSAPPVYPNQPPTYTGVVGNYSQPQQHQNIHNPYNYPQPPPQPQRIAYQQPQPRLYQPQVIQAGRQPPQIQVYQQPQPHVIQVIEVPVVERGNQPPQSHADMTMALYCACCAVLFIPFGVLIGLCVMCCYWQGNQREKIQREKTAYRVLQVCMVLNFIWTIFVIIFNS